MNKFNYKNLCPFKWFVLQNFPFIEADFDAITNWQLFCKLGEEMNKIIEKVNQAGEQTENLTNAFIELQNYVNDYFENLDVQEEIDNKLDEMAESGQLTEIIAQYLQLEGLLCFNNKSDLKNAQNLTNGSFAKTYGSLTYNDGLGNFYKIREILNTDVVDDVNIIALTNYNNLIAELIPQSYINVKLNGVYGDGIHDDTEAIQNLIDNNPKNTLYFPNGNYLISSPLTVPADEDLSVSFKLDNYARIFTNTEIDSLFEIGKIIVEGRSNQDNDWLWFEGGILDCNNTTYGFYGNARKGYIRINKTIFINIKNYGLYLDYYIGEVNSGNAKITNCAFWGITSDTEDISTAIYSKSNDNEFINIRIQRTKIGVVSKGGGNHFSDFHITTQWANSPMEENLQNETVGFELEGINFLNQCYVDTYAKAYHSKSGIQYLTECFTYYWYSTANLVNTILYITDGNFKCSNCRFDLPTLGNNHCIFSPNTYLMRNMNVEERVKCINTKFTKNNSTKINDYGYSMEVNGIDNTPTTYYDNQVLTQNVWQPIAVIKQTTNSVYHLQIAIANVKLIDVIFNGYGYMKATDLLENTADFEIGLLNEFTESEVANGKYYYLCVRKTTGNTLKNMYIKNLTGGGDCQVNAYRDFLNYTMLENPNVSISRTV